MLFWDLDGTIIDVSDKYYNLYKDILDQQGYESLGKKAYWQAKREATPENEILKLTGAEAFYDKYQDKRISLIESKNYLSFDKVHEGVFQVLEYLSMRFNLILVTLRRSPHQLEKQLEQLSLTQFFADVLCSGEQLYPRWKIKYNLIKDYLADNNIPGHFMLGDTEADIIAGNELGLKTIAVLNGIRSERLLLKTNPDIICNSAKDLLKPELINLFDRR